MHVLFVWLFDYGFIMSLRRIEDAMIVVDEKFFKSIVFNRSKSRPVIMHRSKLVVGHIFPMSLRTTDSE